MRTTSRGLVLLACAAIVSTPADSRAEGIIGLATNNTLFQFDTTTGTRIPNDTLITGTTDAIIAIDFRPATGELYGLGLSVIPEVANLYRIDPGSGAATLVGPLAPDPADPTNPFVLLGGLHVGFDFNPIPDRIRITTSTNRNYRVNPNNALVTTDEDLLYDSTTDDGDPVDPNSLTDPRIVGSAYTNSFPGATTTTLYDIDAGLDILAIQNPPNNGVLNTVGPIGFNAGDILGFDISGASGVAYAALLQDGPAVDPFSLIGTIDLSSGAFTSIGNAGFGIVLDISVVPEPTALSLLGGAYVALLRRRRR